MATAARGLSVLGGRLWLRADRRRGTRLRFEPTGIAVVTREAENLLEWESYCTAAPGWRCFGSPPSRYSRAAVTVMLERPHQKFEFPEAVSWSIPSPWLSLHFAWAETAALIQYVATTRRARQGLGNVGALERLLDDIEACPMFERWPPEDHIMGDKLDTDLAIKRVFQSVGVRRIDGRPVRGETLPRPIDLVDRVRREIPEWVRARVPDEQIECQLARFLDVRPWPFDALMAPTPGTATPTRPSD